MTVKSNRTGPSPDTPGVKQDVSQMESANANKIWGERAIFPFHFEPQSAEFRKQSWLEHNWFGPRKQSSRAHTPPSCSEQAVWHHPTLQALKTERHYITRANGVQPKGGCVVTIGSCQLHSRGMAGHFYPAPNVNKRRPGFLLLLYKHCLWSHRIWGLLQVRKWWLCITLKAESLILA